MSAHRVYSVLCVLLTGCTAAANQSPAPAAPAPGAPASGSPTGSAMMIRRVSGSESFVPRTDDASIRAFRPDVAPLDSGGECSVFRTGGSGATMVTAGFPARLNPHTSVTIMFDSAGHLIRYSESWGARRVSYPGTFTNAQRDSVMRAAADAVRSTSISIDYGMDQAVVSNHGGGRPTEAILGPVRMIETLQVLGPQPVRLARVRKLCGV